MTVGVKSQAYLFGDWQDLYNTQIVHITDFTVLDTTISAFYDDLTLFEDKPALYENLLSELEGFEGSYHHNRTSETLKKLSNRIANDFLDDDVGNIPNGWNVSNTDGSIYPIILRPDADVVKELDNPAGAHWSKLDDEVFYPYIWDNEDAVIAFYDIYHPQKDIYNCTNPDPEWKVIGTNSVTVWMYGFRSIYTSSADYMSAYISFDNGSNWSSRGDFYFPESPESGWSNYTWNNLDKQTNLTDFQIKLEEGSTWSNADTFGINALYAEVQAVTNMTDWGSKLVSSYDGHNRTMKLETHGLHSSVDFNKTISPAKTSGFIEFWLNKDNYSYFSVEHFFTINRDGFIFEPDGETIIRDKQITIFEWNHYLINFTSTTFDLYYNGIRVGDNIAHDFGTNLDMLNFTAFNQFLPTDESKGNTTRCYINGIDCSWDDDYYPWRGYAYDYSVANITYYASLLKDQIINTSITTNLRENVVEMSNTTREAIFSFNLELVGMENPNVNITLSVNNGFTLNVTSILNSPLKDTINFKISDTENYEYPFVYYVDMNITISGETVYYEKIPFRLRHIENFTLTHTSFIIEEKEFNGGYTATFDFIGDTGDPDDWMVLEGGGKGTVEIISSFGDHTEVVELYDTCINPDPAGVLMFNIFSNQSEGTIEFWYCLNDTSKFGSIKLIENLITSDELVHLKVEDGYYFYKYGTGWINTTTKMMNDVWDRHTISWDAETDMFNWSINGYTVANSEFLEPTPTGVGLFEFTSDLSDGGDSDYKIYIDAIGYSWDPIYEVGDNLLVTDSSVDIGSTKQVSKGDMVVVDFLTNSHNEFLISFLDSDVEQEEYILIQRGHDIGRLQIEFFINSSFSFDEIQFSGITRYSYFDFHNLYIIDGDSIVGESVNPFDINNDGNAPVFIWFGYNNGTDYIQDVQMVLPGDNCEYTANIDTSNTMWNNASYREIEYRISDTNTNYKYIDNFDVSGIHIASIIDANSTTYIMYGESTVCEKDEIYINIIPEETLDWCGYSLDGTNNITFTGNSTFISTSELSDAGEHTLQIFGNNSVGTMYETNVVTFGLYHPINVTSIVNGTTYYGSENKMNITLSTYTKVWFHDFSYSLNGRKEVEFEGCNSSELVELIPFGRNTIEIFGKDKFDDKYSSGLIEFFIALETHTPSFSDDFTFINGTIMEPFGDLMYIDGNITNIRYDSNYTEGYQEVIPTGDHDIEWNTPSSGTHYDDIDDRTRGSGDSISPNFDNMEVDEFSCNSFTIPNGYYIHKVVLWVNLFKMGTGNVRTKISWDDDTTWSPWIYNDEFVEQGLADDYGYTWDNLNKSQTDLNQFSFALQGVGITGGPPPGGVTVYCAWAVIYYEKGGAELDVQVDMEVDDEDIYQVEYLKYSYKTNVSIDVDLVIWDWGTSTWDEIESIDNSATFYDKQVVLTNASDYVNSTNGVRIRYQSTESIESCQLEIDMLKLWYSTTLVPTNLYVTPLQPDNFTLTDGTLETSYGGLVLVDANYSIVKAKDNSITGGGWTAEMKPDGDVIKQWTMPTSGTHWDDVDEDPDSSDSTSISEFSSSNKIDEFSLTTRTIPAGATITKIVARVKALKLGAGSPSIDIYIDGSWRGYKTLTADQNAYNYSWTGLSADQIDLNNMKVRFKTYVSGWPVKGNYIYAVWVYAYYTYPIPNYDMDFQVDLQVTDENCYFPNSISYSFKTNISATIDFDIWNWETCSWYEIESIDNYATFDKDLFILDMGCDYVDNDNKIRLRFQSFDNGEDFELQIDQLRLDYYYVG
ncbi:MAG: hypothetical protein ACFFE4_01545 [Candidatus Thorarchaeota archaeon]